MCLLLERIRKSLSYEGGSRCVAFFYCPEASPLPYFLRPSLLPSAIYQNQCPTSSSSVPKKAEPTSLYNYLIEHPQISPASAKELHFFDLNFQKGIQWYETQISPKIKTARPHGRSKSLLPLSSPSTPTPVPTLSPRKTNRTAEKPRNQSHIPLPSRNQAGI